MLSCLASIPILLLGAKLDIAGETSKVVFNAYGANVVPMEMVARNGQLNLSGVLLANDVVTMSGTSFSAMAATVANLSATIAVQHAMLVNLSTAVAALEQKARLPQPAAPPPPGPSSCAQGNEASQPPATTMNPVDQPGDQTTTLCSEYTYHKGDSAGSTYIMTDSTLGNAERWGTYNVGANACKTACSARADCKGFDYYGPEIGPGYHLKQCAMYTNQPNVASLSNTYETGNTGTGYWRTYTKK